MLRFDSSQQPRPRNYLARREQVRLLTMVTALALVGLMAWQVRSERSRAILAHLFGGPPPHAALPAATQAKERAAESDIPPEESRQWLNVVQLDSILDNAVFRDAETDAWFAVLGQLKAHEAPLADGPATTVTYTQLAKQPQAYRGRTVRVRGTIQRVEPQTPAENELGIDRLYRVIFRPEGDEVWPIAAYTLTPPDGIELGADVRRPGSVVGVFFKNLSYQSQAGAGTMPIVLAQTVQPAPKPVAVESRPPAPIGQRDLMSMAAIAAGIAALIVMVVLRQAKKPAA
ncbi:hypothetical protein KOR34_46540 [Posidoniimonas corsicana]|uniref:Uncharacterized protein n=1 Tax=Posidoniimonas corsicana TaxID=1938618 RepID=A0A5C5UYR4_9BACT|nr:hypothetical protein [Posidoniimonas corsicana]TWT31278.1 hypothetical protein KOR34_46540 [Posidoniimonas corsicana]